MSSGELLAAMGWASSDGPGGQLRQEEVNCVRWASSSKIITVAAVLRIDCGARVEAGKPVRRFFSNLDEVVA